MFGPLHLNFKEYNIGSFCLHNGNNVVVAYLFVVDMYLMATGVFRVYVTVIWNRTDPFPPDVFEADPKAACAKLNRFTDPGIATSKAAGTV
jgi:hypothetical protein